MQNTFSYDAFISHAVEDKLAIANELCERLEKEGLSIWYSGKELRTGSSINDTILEGLKQSRYGIVILSKNYLSKTWPIKELHILMGRESPTRKIILPILFGVTPEDLAREDIYLADRFAVRAEIGMDRMVEKLVNEIKQRKSADLRIASQKERKKRWTIALVSIFVLAITFLIRQWTEITSPAFDARQLVQGHINTFAELAEAPANIALEGKRISGDTLRKVFEEFQNIKSYYRNEYVFEGPDTTIRFKKYVEPALGIDVSKLTPANQYLMLNPEYRLLCDTLLEGRRVVKYSVTNTQPLLPSHHDTNDHKENSREVKVVYENNIRWIVVTLEFPDYSGIRKHKQEIHGFFSRQLVIFKRHSDEWEVTSVK